MEAGSVIGIPPLDELPLSVCFDAFEAMQAAADNRLNYDVARIWRPFRKVNERRLRYFDPHLAHVLSSRGLIKHQHGKVVLTDKVGLRDRQ